MSLLAAPSPTSLLAVSSLPLPVVEVEARARATQVARGAACGAALQGGHTCCSVRPWSVSFACLHLCLRMRGRHRFPLHRWAPLFLPSAPQLKSASHKITKPASGHPSPQITCLLIVCPTLNSRRLKLNSDAADARMCRRGDDELARLGYGGGHGGARAGSRREHHRSSLKVERLLCRCRRGRYQSRCPGAMTLVIRRWMLTAWVRAHTGGETVDGGDDGGLRHGCVLLDKSNSSSEKKPSRWATRVVVAGSELAGTLPC